MKLRYTIGLIGLALAGAIVGGCSANGSIANTNPAGAQLPFARPADHAAYKQIELLSRPAVKEAFEMFEDHNKTNRSEPYNDPVLQGEIESFAAAFRDQTTAQTLQAVLYPNVMKVDLSQNTTSASYLGYETGGATGSKFGGRGLNDDIIDISLGAIFGNTLSALGLIPDDHKELPCLTTDNVAYDKSNNKTFPYIQAPL
ncbi:MAG TPA: DUF4331 family protein [Candidatus Baltobacteraceae bacterium]|jgi:hypothetical protein|nr:DUF4331 family protein [Candidatus Baltobacteraceae bacterium]